MPPPAVVLPYTPEFHLFMQNQRVWAELFGTLRCWKSEDPFCERLFSNYHCWEDGEEKHLHDDASSKTTTCDERLRDSFCFDPVLILFGHGISAEGCFYAGNFPGQPFASATVHITA
jgi:hypothetical protein